MSYDNWKTGHYGDDRFSEDDRLCICCMDKIEDKKYASEFLEAIVEHLFSKEPINRDKLVFWFEELCAYLDVKMPDGMLDIKRKDSKVSYIDDWIHFNNQHLKSLTK